MPVLTGSLMRIFRNSAATAALKQATRPVLRLRLRRHEIGRQRRAFAEEVVVHLLDQKLLRFLRPGSAGIRS